MLGTSIVGIAQENREMEGGGLGTGIRSVVE
jgi:hypothetical protein